MSAKCNTMWLSYGLLILTFSFYPVTCFCASGICSNHTLSRSRRHLVFPMGGTFKVVLGIGIPIKLGPKYSMAVGWNIQFQYPTPTNVSELHEYVPILMRKREIRERYTKDRTKIYSALESLMERNGINGKNCLLRSICENAMWSINHPANGLYGQLLHILLTPTYASGGVPISESESAYLDAEKAGRFGVDCESLYSSCPREYNPLDIISVFDE